MVVPSPEVTVLPLLLALSAVATEPPATPPAPADAPAAAAPGAPPQWPVVTHVTWKTKVDPEYPPEPEAHGVGDQECAARLLLDADGSAHVLDVGGCPPPFAASTVAALSQWKAELPAGTTAPVETKVTLRYHEVPGAPVATTPAPEAEGPASTYLGVLGWSLGAIGLLQGGLSVSGRLGTERRHRILGAVLLLGALALLGVMATSPTGSALVNGAVWGYVGLLGVDQLVDGFATIRAGLKGGRAKVLLAVAWLVVAAAMGFPR